MSADSFEYVGHELDIFAHARNWKSYWTSRIRRYVHGDVLEVGAGIGANTNQLQNSDVKRWVCLEPDPMLASQLSKSVGGLGHCSVQVGTVSKITGQSFDSILYIDVLEHIEQDLARSISPSATSGVIRRKHYSRAARGNSSFRR
jgi:2-polyprenyl-3-methyl-5-hydroxy-6-metoxy-1,4-benzoquinol methylase